MRTRPAILASAFKHVCAIALGAGLAFSGAVNAEVGWPEKEDLTFGFIKLTDMVPLAIALERGYFMDEGLFVELEAQANWRVLLDRVISGDLDGAHMLSGQPLASTIGYGTQAHIITAFTMDLNGNACTVSNAVWEAMKPHLAMDGDKPRHPIGAEALIPVIEAFNDDGEQFRLGMVFPVSTHNYELRYWLAAGGIHPGYYAPQRGDTSGTQGADVQISVTPPPQMPATLEAGTINGYCVGEPWNQQAVFRGIGTPVITDYDIRNNISEKVFGVSNEWAERYPNTHIRVVKALIRAGYWLDANDNANREEAARIISEPHYVGADYEVIANSMTGVFEFEKGDVRAAPDFNVFFRYNATYPYYSDAVWYLTQMRRWGQIPEAKPDDWYMETARKVFRPDIYQIAARELIREGHIPASAFPDFDTEDGFRSVEATTFIDGIEFDGRAPNAYLERFEIGLKGDETP
ncbi:nitrate ABC transporter substrate-binding protein [Alkalilimnicola ehrlichii]|uniref:Nitrate ABC transporter substrate-binding protein n=2 Tax=Alkalilimnicola ehrlichii TaxID=351052 RepID=A0A3E0WPN7_9GAMM|nr:CmpA/NrtA family ABC transporter substrate-binding protein [Alkalilimnicola ehrlichii]RFA27043.1 nitrate ABC transporter substrate-binding protein [Alkalilimnicola ehrlichii]RFA34163.1 nitrate ABC transporter substrate-binding protein [Alkalilimnicola ehrlichii]